MRIFTYILIMCTSLGAQAVDVSVRLFSQHTLQQALVSAHSGSYHLIAVSANKKVIDTIVDAFDGTYKQAILIMRKDKKLEVWTGQKKLGRFDALQWSPADNTSSFVIKGSGPERLYGGVLQISVNGNEILIVNQIDLEEYVAGVVESEGGHVDLLPYLKAQAVLARTYALKNINKHIRDGYNLKDDVTSQVYLSKCYLQNCKLIRQAVTETRDSVLVTDNGELVFGAFHSNSGGFTANAEDAWSSPIEYLRARPDSFSVGQPRSLWVKEVDKEAFIGYVARWFGTSAQNQELRKAICSFNQDNYRHSHFEYQGRKLPLKYLRKDFSLRSTYFNVVDNGKTLRLEGRGYGHGVGLSQEGAMEMARRGYEYQDILFYYFDNVRINHFDTVFSLVPEKQ